MKRYAIVLACALTALLGETRLLAQASTQTPAKPATNTTKRRAAPAAKPKSAATAQPVTTLKDDKEKVSYAFGLNMGANLRRQMIEINTDILAQGLKDGYSNSKPLMTEDESIDVLQNMQSKTQARMEQKHAEEAITNKAQGQGFLAANKNQNGVVTLPSGLQYKVLTQGSGPKPTETDTVVCNYRGTLIDGTEFDSSAKHGQPLSFPVGGVIRGWTEALQLMPVGSKWQLFIPAELAYGERGRPGIPPNATLIFEVELLSIQPKQ